MFICLKCGECCRAVKDSEITKHLDRGDGICAHFCDNSNICTIYDSRPLICRVCEGYDVFFSKNMTRQEFYEINYKICEYLRSKT